MPFKELFYIDLWQSRYSCENRKTAIQGYKRITLVETKSWSRGLTSGKFKRCEMIYADTHSSNGQSYIRQSEEIRVFNGSGERQRMAGWRGEWSSAPWLRSINAEWGSWVWKHNVAKKLWGDLAVLRVSLPLCLSHPPTKVSNCIEK